MSNGVIENQPHQSVWGSIVADGWSETLLKAQHRLRILSVKHTFLIYAGKISDINNTDVSEEQLIEIREIFREDLSWLTFAPGFESKEVLNRHFSDGYRIFAAFNKNQVIAINGVHGDCVFLSYVRLDRFKLPQGYIYLNLAFTSPDWRGRGIGTQLRQTMLGVVSQSGKQDVLLVTHLENRGARNWHANTGFDLIGKLSYLKWKKKENWVLNFRPEAKRYPDIRKNLENHVNTAGRPLSDRTVKIPSKSNEMPVENIL